MSYELVAPASVERAAWQERLHGPQPKRAFIKFTKAWLDAGGVKWCGNKFFEIVRTVVVPYSLSYTIPGNDYKDIDLSNAKNTGKLLYPDAENRVYEILVGLKPGAWHTVIYLPPNRPLLALGDSTMYADMADADKRFLGGISPEYSPADDPVIKLWTIKDYDAYNTRIVTLSGIDFEKCTFEFKIAKHDLRPMDVPPRVFTTIPHHSEVSGIW